MSPNDVAGQGNVGIR